MTKSKNEYKFEVLTLSDAEIRNNVKQIMGFLKAVHPELIGEGYKPVTEIKFINRITGHSFQNPNLWALDNATEEYLFNEFKKRNGEPYCVYFSCFNFYNTEERKINANNANSTYVLPSDFDDMTEEEFEEQKQMLMGLDIETVDISSGNGFQAFVLLEDECKDKEVYKKFTTLLLRKGFKVDSAIKDCPRVMRLTNTFNCKQFDKKKKNHYKPIDPKGIPTFVKNTTTRRYKLEDVFAKVESLPDEEIKRDNSEVLNWLNEFSEEPKQDKPKQVKPKQSPKKEKKKDPRKVMVEAYLDEFFSKISEEENTAAVEPLQSLKEKEEINEPKNEQKQEFLTAKQEKANITIKTPESIKKLYKHINFSKFSGPVQKILMGTPKEGIGNDCLLFLVPLLRNSEGLSLEKQIETMQTWGKLCVPIWDEEQIKHEVIRLNKYDFKAKYGAYTPEMEIVFGQLDFTEWKIKNDITIPNVVFERIDKLSDGAFRLFLAIKLLEHQTKKDTFTIDDICKAANMAPRTFEKHISYLTKTNIIVRKKNNRVKGQKYEYSVNTFLSETPGFTKIKAILIRSLIKEGFTGGEPSLFLYIYYMAGNTGDGCFSSQQYLADKLGKTQQAISVLTDSLNEKGYIRKETEKIGRVKHSTYTLNY